MILPRSLLSCLCFFIAAAQASSIPCDNILTLQPTVWVQQYQQAHSTDPSDTVTAIYQYRHCYNSALDALNESLNKTDRFPLMGARGNFQDLELAIKAFTNNAIRSCGQSSDRVRIQRAYADLYALQFRRLFLRQYQANQPELPDDPAFFAMAKQSLQAMLAKMPEPQQKTLRQSYDQLKAMAVQENNMPEWVVDVYALIVVSNKGDFDTIKPFLLLQAS